MQKVELQTLLSSLSNISRHSEIANTNAKWAYANEERVKFLNSSLDRVIKQLRIVDLKLSVNKAESIKRYLDVKDLYDVEVVARKVSISVEELRERIEEELEDRDLYYLARSHAQLIDDGENLYGTDVTQKFRNSVADLVEAARCLGLSCNTACVFHLMRSMERALQDMGKHFAVTIVNKNNKPLSWGEIVSNIDNRVREMPPSSLSDFGVGFRL